MLSVAAQRALRRLRRGKAAAAELDRLPPAERAVVGRQFLLEVEGRLAAADRALAAAEADLLRLRAQRAALGEQVTLLRQIVEMQGAGHGG